MACVEVATKCTEPPIATVPPVRIRAAALPTLVLTLVAGGVVTAPADAATHAATDSTAYAQVEGTGSTWAEPVVQQWATDVHAERMSVVYTGGGASKGRRDFAQGNTDFSVSELPYQGVDEQGNADTSSRPYAYVPVVAGGVAFAYRLEVGGRQVRDLRLSGDTIAGIFTGAITDWSDPAITADNAGRALPSLPIRPVVRADGSGTTAQLTTWLDSEHPELWRAYLGRPGATSYFPRQGRMLAQAGSDQVVNTVAGLGGNGTIGYVESSYPAIRDLPVAAVSNAAGAWVRPEPRTVWRALREATVDEHGTVDLTAAYESTSVDAYPLPYVASAIVPTSATDARMTTAKRQTLVDVLDHALCAGQGAATAYGDAPLPLNLVRAGFRQLAEIGAGDPAVDLTGRDVASCVNPTFDAATLADVPPAYVPVPVEDPMDPTEDPFVEDPFVEDPFVEGPFVTAPTATVPADQPRPAATPLLSAGKPVARVTQAPTRREPGRAAVRVRATDGATISGTTRAVLTLKRGRWTIRKKLRVTLVDGRARFALPRLPKAGRWKARLTLPASALVTSPATSRPFRVRVGR
jgi:phosphate transport system substrate-binding protein